MPAINLSLRVREQKLCYRKSTEGREQKKIFAFQTWLTICQQTDILCCFNNYLITDLLARISCSNGQLVFFLNKQVYRAQYKNIHDKSVVDMVVVFSELQETCFSNKSHFTSCSRIVYKSENHTLHTIYQSILKRHIEI